MHYVVSLMGRHTHKATDTTTRDKSLEDPQLFSFFFPLLHIEILIFHIQDQKEYKDRVHRETNMRGMGNVNCTGEEEDGHSQKNF